MADDILSPARYAWRAFDNSELPAEGEEHKPQKEDILTFATAVQTGVDQVRAAAAGGYKGYKLLSAMNADLTPIAGTLAKVEGVGTFIKVGGPGTGSWGEFTDPLAAQAQAVTDGVATVNTALTTVADAVSDAQGYAADALAAASPSAQLPACVKHFYPCDEGAGTTLRDIIGGATADLTTGTGYSWAKGGWLQLTNGWFKLPSMAHRCIIVVLRAPENATGYYFCNKDGLAVGPTYGNSAASIPTFKMLSGWGIHDLTRRNDAGGSSPYELQSGGWIMPAPVFSSTVTGTPVIGAANTGGAGAITKAEVAAIIVADAVPTGPELRRILDFERPRQSARGIYLTFDDCPVRRVLVISRGESTDEGTFYAAMTGTVSGTTLTVNSISPGSTLLADHAFHNGALAGVKVVKQLTGTAGGAGTYQLSAPATVASPAVFYFSGLSIESQDGFSQTTFISASNVGNASTYQPLARLSARPGYQNNVPANKLTTAPISGWEMGFKAARNERPDDGRQADHVKLGVGSTTLLPGGDDDITTTTTYTNALGTDTVIPASASRNVGLIPGGGLFSNLHSRSRHRREQHGRNDGIGYYTVIDIMSPGLNDAYVGALAVTAGLFLDMLEDDRAFTIADTGISNLIQLVAKPHDPTGVAPGTLGLEPDYPAGAVGTSRLTALHRIQDDIDAFGAAHSDLIEVLNDNDYTLNSAAGDPVHQDAAGLDKKGRDIEQRIRTRGFYAVTVVPTA